jgi:hypothetical protein
LAEGRPGRLTEPAATLLNPPQGAPKGPSPPAVPHGRSPEPPTLLQFVQFVYFVAQIIPAARPVPLYHPAFAGKM